MRSNGGRISLTYNNILNSEVEKSNMEYLSKPPLLASKTLVNQESPQSPTENRNNGFDMKKIEAENNSLRALLKCRDSEICKLKREIHKLKVSTIFDFNHFNQTMSI